MCARHSRLIAILAVSILFLFSGQARAQTPTITFVSPTAGAIGASVTIIGTNFGATQGTSTVSLNGTNAAVTSWNNNAIVAVVPSGATSGNFCVTINGQTAASALAFTVTVLPSGWSDGDVGSVGLAGSANYANGTFTVKGSGQDIYGSSDGFRFLFQPLSGDGSIVARVTSLQGGGSYPKAGVMIRETLNNAGSTNAFMAYQGNGQAIFDERTSTGGSTGQATTAMSLPSWVKVVRSGNSFSGYKSVDGANWAQVGSTQTINMAQSVYIGLAVTSTNNSALDTATFDNVSVSSTAAPAPVISSLSASSGAIGGQVAISGSGFGAAQGSSLVLMNGALAPATLWSDTAITITIPASASSGPLTVLVGPSMNCSNPVTFTVTLPTGWLDQDVGVVGLAGSASYASGTFTMKGAGAQVWGTADGFNFAYQSLSGDGTMVARVTSLQGGNSNSQSAGLMIRESLNAGSTNVYAAWQNSSVLFDERATTGGNSSSQSGGSGRNLPYWLKVVRSGSTFSGYMSSDGVSWTQVGTSQTISMAQNVYVGLVVNSSITGTLATATFDSVSISTSTAAAPVIRGLSTTSGGIGSEVEIYGSGFGASQGTSVVTLNGISARIIYWSDTIITITVPAAATSGPLVVAVGPSMNSSNPVNFTVTLPPLLSGWLDQDVGSVGLAGSATYSNGTFTVKGAGNGLWSTADGFHFVYQPMSGDGTIVARVSSLGSNVQTAGVDIRESLNANAKSGFMEFVSYYNSPNFNYRTATGGSTSQNWLSGSSLPYWVKVVRSGSTVTAYGSGDGVTWAQVGSHTISMAQNIYVGLGVASGNTYSLATAAFDNVSVSSTAAPAPVITSLSATGGPVGSEVGISGTGFGASQGGSVVTLNGAPVTVNYWSDTAITITIPPGATSGPLMAQVGPTMNVSNAVGFTVTSQPLPAGWLDQDIGSVGPAGSATYSNGTFTAQGAGTSLWNTADGFHFVYQSLSGDGWIVARVTTQTSGSAAGVDIRESLNANAESGFVWRSGPSGSVDFNYRLSTGGSTSQSWVTGGRSLPYWVKVVRSGSTITAYGSGDGVNWEQVGNQTITMQQNVYVGLGVSSGSTSTLATANLDNVSITYGTAPPAPVVTGVSPAVGKFGATVTINGAHFGATQGTSTAQFNGTIASSITSWSDTQIVAAVPNTATSGPVQVVVSSVGSNRNISFSMVNPVISTLTPPAAEIGGYVTLSGSGFGAYQGNSTVQFNGASAVITSWSDASVVVQVPAGATSGSVVLTETGIASNAVAFSVIEGISVTAISPAAGPVGTSVTITGTGFGPTQSNSVASFDGVAASITSWSDTQIVAVVPGGVSSGPVAVKVAGVTAYGPTFFLTFTAQLTDSLGNSSTYAAEAVGGQWRVTDAQGSGCSSCTLRGTTHYSYDASGNILSMTDPLGNVTTYTYDSSNNLLSESRPIGSNTATTAYTYNSLGEVLTVTDPLGNVTTNAYDAKGNLTSVTSPAPDGNTAASVTQFAYDTKGELTQFTDPLGHITTLTYTSAGLIATIKDAQNNVTTYAYDAHGNRTSVTDALNNQTTFAYDAGDRLATITYPGGSTTTSTYDTRGRRASVTDQKGKTTSYTYDDADRLIKVTDAAANATQYAYDTESNLTSITDAATHVTFFTYDAFGRVTQTNFPSTLSENYAYDAGNNLTSKTDRKGQAIAYVYDALNRLTKKQYPDATEVDYVYDLVGKIQSVNDPTGTYAFAYDNMGRLTGTTTNYSFLTGRNFTTSYAYDKASNRTGFTDPEGGATAYAYDTLNRLQTLTPPAAFTATGNFGFSYDALSRRTQLTRPNGVATNYAYDNLSRLTSVLHQLAGSTIDGASYTVDAAGNRTSKTDRLANVTSNYSYDAIYQLTQAVQGANTTESYSYDPVGNRLSSLGLSPYSYNVSNQLTSKPGVTFTYDYNGNVVTKNDSTGITAFNWDIENRLTTVILPGSGGTVTFKYDPFGRRIYKSSSAGTSVFAYDGDNLIEETNSAGSSVARYSQTGNIDEPLAMLRGAATSFYHADGLGSVTSLSNGAGALAQTYTFDSFGKQTASSGSLTNPFQYTGRESDPETGLYFYRARYYDPSVGRFLSEDPLRFWVASSFYPYAYNEPTLFIDPRGLGPQKGAPKPGDSWTNHLPGVLWIKCKIWGYYCLKTVLDNKMYELQHPGTDPTATGAYSPDELAHPEDDEKRQIERCAAGDDNCKKFLAQCGDQVLGPIKGGMFPH